MILLKAITVWALLSLTRHGHVISDDNPCRDKTTCGQCLRASPDCAWCSYFSPNISHQCDVIGKLNVACPKESLEAPDQTQTTVKVDDFRDHPTNSQTETEQTKTEAVQLKPQHVSLKLRIEKEAEIILQFKMAKNFPVDLYYLFVFFPFVLSIVILWHHILTRMDLSHSMKKHKDAVADMGIDIAKIFEKGDITGNFRLGFGGFCDKTVPPFIVDTKDFRENPCIGEDYKCDPPFSFKHKMALTDDVASFKSIVREAGVTANTDGPEGGLEAVLQVIKCETQIGWRNVSRKVIVYSSDALFHTAGDGRLAGIIEPNTGKCRLNAANELPGDEPYDYPSVGQVRAAALSNNVNLIFAVKDDTRILDAYHQLSDLIEGSAVGAWSSTSSNIIDLIRKNYNKISSEVILATSQIPPGLSIGIDARCPKKPKFENGRDNCAGVSFGQNVTFRLRLRADASLCELAPNGTIVVSLIGFSDSFRIDYSVICSCGCENDEKTLDKNCSMKGSKQCGVCYCEKGYSGRTCKCKTGTSASLVECKNPASKPAEQACSGRGGCDCGECHCIPGGRFHGDYCECDDEDCPRNGGLLCSGNGVCSCGKCICKFGYIGQDCSCLKATSLCYRNKIGPTAEDPKKCSGHGTCDCGKCRCEAGYFGETCNDCPSCSSQCLPNRDCAFCRAGFSKEECNANCSHIQVADEQESSAVADLVPANAQECNYPAPDQPECVVQFWYWYAIGTSGNSSIQGLVNPKYRCPKPVPIAAIAGGIGGGIVFAILMAFLIWKLVVMCQDAREFARLEEMEGDDMLQTGKNLLYKSATADHKNHVSKLTRRMSSRFFSRTSRAFPQN